MSPWFAIVCFLTPLVSAVALAAVWWRAMVAARPRAADPRLSGVLPYKLESLELGAVDAAPAAPIRPEPILLRVICLATVVERARVERLHRLGFHSRAGQDGASRHDLNRLNAWILRENLFEQLTDAERNLIQLPTGSWDETARRQAQWSAEGLAVLAWSLYLLETLPPPEHPFDPETLALGVDLCAPLRPLLLDLARRDDEEILRARRIAQAWVWRTASDDPHALMGSGNVWRSASAIRERAWLCGHQGYFTPLDGDFPALGLPYARLERARRESIAIIAAMRLQAFEWICGRASAWDRIVLPR